MTPREAIADVGRGIELCYEQTGAWGRIIDLITDHTSWVPVSHIEVEEQA